jgi:hypothetical protein
VEVAADVGADRAFLLSESGFQRGAREAASSRPVTLASLAELRAAAEAGGVLGGRSTAQLYVADAMDHEDHGMGPWTDLFLRRTDGGVIEGPLVCVLVHPDGRQWEYPIPDASLGTPVVEFTIHPEMRGEPAAGTTYEVVWRTVDGPVFGAASLDNSK